MDVDVSGLLKNKYYIMYKKIIKNILSKLIPNDDIGLSNRNAREIWLENTLKKIPEGNSILDAGAGELQYKKFCNHLNYTSQDFGKYDGNGNNDGLQMGNWDNSKLDIISDITKIPREDKSFDTIMCIEVFEHIPDPNLAIKELARLLRKNGKLILTSPFCSMTHFAPYHFSTGFSKYYYEKLLEENGLKILEITPNGNYYKYLAQLTRGLPDVVTKYSNSKMNIFEKLFILLMLKILNKYNKKDTGSKELLCFGYHVLAEKII
jgi:ubiquinone/menaquinone biosynthesis C-methylase UbiE